MDISWLPLIWMCQTDKCVVAQDLKLVLIIDHSRMIQACRFIDISKYDGGQLMSAAKLCLDAVVCSVRFSQKWFHSPLLASCVWRQDWYLCYLYFVGVWRVQIIWVNCSQAKNRLDIEPSRILVSTITGNNMQYGDSLKQQKYKDKSFELRELADVII